MVWKKGQFWYISVNCASRSILLPSPWVSFWVSSWALPCWALPCWALPSAPFSTQSDKAVPTPYQLGRFTRDCVHEKPQGMARKSASEGEALGREGREPILRREM